MSQLKCACCGRFTKFENAYGLAGDSDDCGNYDEWIECVDCLSQFDRERFGVDKKSEAE